MKQMYKINMVLTVSDFTKSKIDWQIEACQEYGTTIGICALDENKQFMVDIHVVESFPELELIDLEDEGEGDMSYHGTLSPQELVDKLKSLGFVAELV
jgi:hypothetical protein